MAGKGHRYKLIGPPLLNSEAPVITLPGKDSTFATAWVSLRVDKLVCKATGKSSTAAEAKALARLIVAMDDLSSELNSRIVEATRLYNLRIK